MDDRTKRSVPVFTDEQIRTAIDLAAQGKPLKTIIDEIITSEFEFWQYRQHNPEFGKSFEQARQEGLEHIADALLTLADEETDVQRARLKSDNFRWLLSKRKPAIYGDKIDLNINQTVDVSMALKEARQRALPQTPEDPLQTLIDVTPTKKIESK